MSGTVIANSVNDATSTHNPGGRGGPNTYLSMLGDVQEELERLRIQHRWLQMCLKDKIVFAPVDLNKEGLKILDMGCADGTLLRDLQKNVPSSAELVGADVSTIFMPTSSQGNIRYVTQDVCDPPANNLKGIFDLTHVRHVLHSTSRSGVEKAVAHLAETLAPGGWLQTMEMDFSLEQPGQPQALKDAIRVVGDLMEAVGMDREYPRQLPEAFKKAGLQNVVVEKIDCKIGRVYGNDADMNLSIEPFKRAIPLMAKRCKSKFALAICKPSD